MRWASTANVYHLYQTHLSALREKQHLMTLFLPQFQQRLHDHHLPRSFPVTVFIGFGDGNCICFVVSDAAENVRSAGRQVGMIAHFAKSNKTGKHLQVYAIRTYLVCSTRMTNDTAEQKTCKNTITKLSAESMKL